MQSIDQAAVTQLAPGGRHHRLGRAERIRENAHPPPATRVKTHKLPLCSSIYTHPITRNAVMYHQLQVKNRTFIQKCYWKASRNCYLQSYPSQKLNATSSPHFYSLTQITILYHQLQVKNRKCSSIQNLLTLKTFPQSLHLELPFPTAQHTHPLITAWGLGGSAQSQFSYPFIQYLSSYPYFMMDRSYFHNNA